MNMLGAASSEYPGSCIRNCIVTAPTHRYAHVPLQYVFRLIVPQHTIGCAICVYTRHRHKLRFSFFAPSRLSRLSRSRFNARARERREGNHICRHVLHVVVIQPTIKKARVCGGVKYTLEFHNGTRCVEPFSFMQLFMEISCATT